MFSITSNYLSIFKNTPPASWTVYSTRDFFTWYSCLYYICSFRKNPSDTNYIISTILFWVILSMLLLTADLTNIVQFYIKWMVSFQQWLHRGIYQMKVFWMNIVKIYQHHSMLQKIQKFKGPTWITKGLKVYDKSKCINRIPYSSNTL